MKKLSLLITLIAAMFIATPAFAKTKAKKRTTTTVVKTKKRSNVKTTTVKKNGKVVKKTTVVTKTKPQVKRPKKVVKVHRHPKKVHRHPHRVHHRKLVKGDRVSILPGRPIRVVRHGAVHFRVGHVLYRPVYKRGRTHYVVVSV